MIAGHCRTGGSIRNKKKNAGEPKKKSSYEKRRR